jgi:anti-sigma28 factor (negative regulator of flagellin synthesis)
MPMKVQNSNSSSLSRLQNTGAASSRGHPSSPDAGKSPGDHVQISTLSSALTATSVHSGEQAVKVMHLSDAVASSRYQVDAEVVSARLIREHMRAAA